MKQKKRERVRDDGGREGGGEGVGVVMRDFGPGGGLLVGLAWCLGSIVEPPPTGPTHSVHRVHCYAKQFHHVGFDSLLSTGRARAVSGEACRCSLLTQGHSEPGFRPKSGFVGTQNCFLLFSWRFCFYLIVGWKSVVLGHQPGRDLLAAISRP